MIKANTLLLPLCLLLPSSLALARFEIPSKTSQLLVVVTSGWGEVGAEIHPLQRRGGRWEQTSPTVQGAVGHGGLAWGVGLHPTPVMGPLKREGDGRSPAGVFRLGKLIGQGAAPPPGTRLPYQQATASLRCVDDPFSRHYNQLIEAPGQGPAPWRSAEVILGAPWYVWAIRVDHNPPPAVAQRGSCIFLHPWTALDQATVGCTAMDQGDLITLILWVDPEAQPLLVQLPRPVYQQHGKAWKLPDLSP